MNPDKVLLFLVGVMVGVICGLIAIFNVKTEFCNNAVNSGHAQWAKDKYGNITNQIEWK